MSDPVDRAFQELRLEYLASLPARLEELRSDLASRRTGDPTVDASLKVRLHRLAGSGGSYGFSHLSSLAREAERCLANHPAVRGQDELQRIVDRLAQAAADAEVEVRKRVGG